MARVSTFSQAVLRGISENDVWKKINELNQMYQAALEAERIRYNTMLEHYKKTGEDPQDGEMAHD
jgi:hypothetical protein